MLGMPKKLVSNLSTLPTTKGSHSVVQGSDFLCPEGDIHSWSIPISNESRHSRQSLKKGTSGQILP